MSVCMFIASNSPLPEMAPSKEYPLEIDVDRGTVDDGGSDDNFFLLTFQDVQTYTNKKYGVCLEWRYTDGRAEKILDYIKCALEHEETIEIWKVWLMDYYEEDDRPVIRKRMLSVDRLNILDIRNLDELNVWCSPDQRNPGRPLFCCLVVDRKL